MVNQNLMDQLERLGFGADVDALESYVATLQDAAGMGAPLVTDAQYDMYYKLLHELKGDSEVLKRNWETDDNELEENDELLLQFRMMSIKTVQNMDELSRFEDAIEDMDVNLLASIKLNGHAVRAVYRYGHLVGGSTRGRTKKGRDITRHLKATLPNFVEAWKDVRVLEVRGEMLVSLENFEQLRYKLKTPLSAVTSLIRDSVTDEELEYLNCVCYKIIPCTDSALQFETLEEQFIMLENNGFEIPTYRLYDDISSDNLMDMAEVILEDFSADKDADLLPYYTDGIVVAIDDCEQFESLGLNGNAYMGNFAMKMGRHWKSDVYQSVIEDIEFVHGKRYITPKAQIEPVITSSGAEVSTVPLYNVGVMDKYKLIPGATIYFKHGGETGVTLCDEMGVMIGEQK